MPRLRRVSIFVLLFLVCGFLLWRTMVSYFPLASVVGTDAVSRSELTELRREVEQLQSVARRIDLAQVEVRNGFDELREFVAEKNLSVPVRSADLTRFQDLEGQVRFFHSRVEQDLGRMRNVESALRDLATQWPDGRPYALRVDDIQRGVDARLAQFEQSNREFSAAVDKRIEQWNDTLQFLAAILAIVAAVVFAFIQANASAK